MAERKSLIAGNWKMCKTIPEAKELVEGLKKNLAGISDREILVCPPFTALAAVAETLKGSNISVGSQNIFWEKKGAFTGEVSPDMIVGTGCKFAIVGHSERRQYFSETDETVNKRMKAAFVAGLIPIVCVGEMLAERENGTTFKVVDKQVKNGVAGITPDNAKTLVLAYEPVWAIGTGKTATPQQAEEVHAYIRKIYSQMYGETAANSVRILYGGSVKPDNATEIMKQPNVDGALVGGASLEIESFTKIVKY